MFYIILSMVLTQKFNRKRDVEMPILRDSLKWDLIMTFNSLTLAYVTMI